MPRARTGLGLCAEPALMILAGLAGGPLDSAEMVVDLHRDGVTGVTASTLYCTLARLEAQGLITSPGDGGSGTRYQLTPAGADALGRWLLRLESFASGGLARLADAQEALERPPTGLVDLREQLTVHSRG